MNWPGLSFKDAAHPAACVVGLLLLAACSPSAIEPASIEATATIDYAPAPQDTLTYGLVAGDYRLVLSGVTAGTALDWMENAAPPVEYSPAAAGMRHPGTNQSGNVGLRFSARLDDGRYVALLLEFPGDIGAGTYDTGTNSDLNPAPVGAALQVTGRAPFDQHVSGTLVLDFANRRTITGTFDVTLRDTDNNAVTARGAFNRIPFTPREEYSIQISPLYRDIESGLQSGKGVQDSSRFIILPFTARQAFQAAVSGAVTITAADFMTLQPGDYAVLAPDSPVSVRVVLDGAELPITAGTVLFTRTFDTINGVSQSVWQGAFTVTIQTEAGEITLSGVFNYFDLY